MANYATSALKLSDTYVNTLPYGVCSTSGADAAKIVNVGLFGLDAGAMAVVKFTEDNTAASPTLAVSVTGAKPIFYNGAAIQKDYLKANKAYQFVYDGSYWQVIGEVGSLPTSGGAMTGTIDVSGTQNVLDFGTTGYFRGSTSSGNKFDFFALVNSTNFRVGGSYPNLQLLGKGDRPTYNGSNMALQSDIPSTALIVTGNLPETYTPDGKMAYAFTTDLNLSHTTEEMIEAFESGREVLVRLVPVNYESEFGGWQLNYAELKVRRATVLVAGMYDFYAEGFGYTSSYYLHKVVPLQIYCSLNPSPRLYVTIKDSEDKSPLIVTGNFPTSWSSSSSGATTQITDEMNLSHTVEEMCEAFQDGRDVFIRLFNSDSTYEFGNWNLRYAELQVCEAEANTPVAGYHKFNAYGTGYAQDAGSKAETTPMSIFSVSNYQLICTPIKKLDPLVVTGNFPTGWTSQPEGAVAGVTSEMNLSKTTAQICEAFQAGREVIIKLTSTGSSQEFGKWDLYYAELKVTSAEANVPAEGYYNLDASGTAYALTGATKIRMYCSMSQTLKLCVPINKQDANVITGSPEPSSIAMSGSTYAIYTTGNISFDIDKIISDITYGRDVYIRLKKSSSNMYLGTSKVLPDIQYIEAKVVNAYKDTMYPNGTFVAHGEGLCGTSADKFYRVSIAPSISGSVTKLTVTAYLYKAATS